MTHVHRFAEFVARSPGLVSTEAAHEARRIILDSVGCALAAQGTPAAHAGIGYGRILGAGGREATIIGEAEPSSAHGAAFANAELMNALDHDAVAAPGHVAPYVVPVALALGEALDADGALAATAVAVCHEMSHRLAKAMDRNRDVKDGRADTPPVLGYASTVFGITAAAAVMKGMGADAVANALGIAGATSPVNSHRAWLEHAPTSTIKNHLMPGGVASTALAAAFMAEFGHRGDVRILDDEEFGYPRFIGTRRWEPSALTTALGEEWRFLGESYFKPWPHCRVPHAVFDATDALVREHDLLPEEITSIVAWGEQWGELPTFMNRDIQRPFDAQFSFTHGIAMVAHRVPAGRQWQDPDRVYDPSVMSLADRTHWRAHPDWASAVTRDPGARPAKVEIVARGTTFVAERDYPRGSPSPDPTTAMSDDELLAKFLVNAEGVIAADDAARTAQTLLTMDSSVRLRDVMRLLRPR